MPRTNVSRLKLQVSTADSVLHPRLVVRPGYPLSFQERVRVRWISD
jgi:hypothetical protein